MNHDDVIGSELGRLIIGGRGPSRPELRMDLTGQFARLSVAHRLQMADVGQALMPVMRRVADALRHSLTTEGACEERDAEHEGVQGA